MINWLTELCLRNRAVVVAVYLALAVWGAWAVTATPVDAIPDLSDNQVIVFTDWSGHGAQEVEDQVTYPLTSGLQGLSGVRVVRSQSAFGFSMVYVIFEDNVDLYFARGRVLERMNLLTSRLPSGVVPILGPDATGVGHVFWYTVEGEGRSLRELRSIQDWFIRYQLNAVPGVAEVASIGGTVQQYQIDVDPDRLRAYGVPLSAVVTAVRESNRNVGGNVLETNGAWAVVRGVGLVTSADDIGNIAIGAAAGVPIYVNQVATVKVGDAFRVASLVKGTQEAVGGVIVARTGVNTQQVIDAVKARIAQIGPGLPKGVRIVPFYDRSALIKRSIGTLRTALIEEIVLVTLAHVVFLLHFRSVLIVTLPLPLAVLASFLGMHYAGISSNIMSLAGIAIAIGVLVDAGIVVTENAFRFLEQRQINVRDRGAVWRTVQDATRLVARPVFFSMAIILLAFVPVFALTGQEGKLFHPLAFTKTFAVLAATIISVTLVPVLCTLLLRGRMHSEHENPVMRALGGLYRPLLEWALAHGAATLGIAAMLFAGAIVLGGRIGSEFMPPLNEGDLLFMPIADPSISLDENTRNAERQNAALLHVPEVQNVVAKIGRADTSTDPSPLNMTETIVQLKPTDQWRPGMTLDGLRDELDRAATLPGVANIWTMPIINRIDMLTTGIRSEVGVKVFGADLLEVEALAAEVAGAVKTIPGAQGVYADQISSGQYLNVSVDREAAARYGISVGAIQEVVETAIGETILGSTIEGRRRFPIRVRYAPEFRRDAQTLGDVLVASPAGLQVPLREVARIEPQRGPAMISSENGLLVATVLLNVQGRDVGSFITDARRAVDERVHLPPSYYLGWSGRYENQAHARQRLLLVVPIAVAITFVLLYFTYHSAVEAAHVLLAVPFALTGGVYLLWATGYNFSVAVWVGFIALFGTAVQTAVVMVIYLEDAVARHLTAAGGALSRAQLRAAVIEGALLRLRPKVMTVSTVVAGLLPIMWSTRTGAEVMKPLATPVLGGMVSSLLHVLLVTPVIFYWLRARQLPAEADQTIAVRTRRASARPRFGRAPVVVAFVAAITIGTAVWLTLRDRWSPASQVVQAVDSGNLRATLRTESGTLTQGHNRFWIDFEDARGRRIDAGEVRLSATMPMPGMVMSGGVEVDRTDQTGRYAATGDFGMSGVWQMTLQWNGPAGRGSTSFQGRVQ
jgi:Cu(I)/Ag(I) efflux system membrane protein CusA/SilA